MLRMHFDLLFRASVRVYLHGLSYFTVMSVLVPCTVHPILFNAPNLSPFLLFGLCKICPELVKKVHFTIDIKPFLEF